MLFGDRGVTYWRTAVGVAAGAFVFVFGFTYWRTAVLFHEDVRGGALCGRHQKDREGEKSVLRRRSVSPSLPFWTSHPPPLIQAEKRFAHGRHGMFIVGRITRDIRTGDIS